MKRVKEIIKEIEGTTHFQQAFIHISFIKNKTDLRNSYETLEFLGDSILNFSTALFLFHSFPHYSEGQMSKLKQLMVQESTLTHLSKEIGLDKYLKTGKVEKKNHRISKDRILADIFESFLAALYLEKGEKIVHEFLSLTLFLWVKGKENMIWDYKSLLQEFCQSQKNSVDYVHSTEKQGNRLVFVAEVKDELGTFREIGRGKSKSEAEKQAASKVVKKLGIEKKKS